MAEPNSLKGWHVALGCAGGLVVVITLLFSALFYFGFVQRGGVYDDLRIQLAQSQLNQLVPYIELYSAQQGQYPEHLEQVAELIPANIPVFINDASSPPLGTPRNYHYEKLPDDKYVLRSVGADGVPFTDDDIAPNGYEDGETGLSIDRPKVTTAPVQEEQPN